MPTDYEREYQKARHILGDPSSQFTDFFDKLPKKKLRVLDLGCGQGRDTLFIARLGHRVVAVDISETGIAQLQDNVAAENLDVSAVIADITSFKPRGRFDVVVIDRTLHMLDKDSRLNVVMMTLGRVHRGGFVLIADEPRNVPALRQVFESDGDWRMVMHVRGFLFMQQMEESS